MCPVCGEFEFFMHGSDETCDVCGWVDDPIQEMNPDEDHCENVLSLNQARRKYEALKVKKKTE